MKAKRIAVVAVVGLVGLISPVAASAVPKLSVKDARYYARDAVRQAHPNAVRVSARCGARTARNKFSCDVRWRRPYGPQRFGKVRVTLYEEGGQEYVKTAFVR